MSRVRLIMLSLFAMFAMSAVASASASAACSEGGGELDPNASYCIGETLATGEDNFANAPFASKSGASTLVAGISIESESSIGTGELVQKDVAENENGENDEVTVEFKGSRIKGETKATHKCKVSGVGEADELITVKDLDGKLKEIESTEKVYSVLTPEVGTPFVTIEVTNKGGCLVPAGKYEVTGEACGETEAFNVLKVEPKLTFTPAIAEACGTELKLKGVKAKFTTTQELHLLAPNLGKKFGVIEG